MLNCLRLFPLGAPYPETAAWNMGGGCARMYVMDERAVKRDEIHAFARGHKAERLWVFGLRACREGRPV